MAQTVTDPQLEGKKAAAIKAAQRIKNGMRVGLGSGSTSKLVVDEVGRLLKEKTLKDIIAVPTSVATREQAKSLGIPLTTLDETPKLDLCIDGADEVDPKGNMIKGGGGAALWEKIVARAAKRYIIAVDKAKLVDKLGTRYAVPVEVVVFGWTTHVEPLKALGCDPVLRMGKDGSPFKTDEGHYLLDCKFADGIADAAALQDKLLARTGVVDTGLFLGFKPDVIVG